MRRCGWVLLIAVLAACHGTPRHLPRAAVPAGWRELSRARYDRATLYDYVDGGADRYLRRGFKGLAAARYVNAADDELTLDLYDLGTAENARALLAEAKVPHSRPVAVGDEALAHAYGLHFRRGAIYGEVTVPRAEPALQQAAEAFARAACR